MLRFEWDDAKNRLNQRQHGLSFEESVSVFRDPFQLLREDQRDYGGEQRWQVIGRMQSTVLLLVVHTIRDAVDGSEIVRIISARYVTPQERRKYETQDGLVHF